MHLDLCVDPQEKRRYNQLLVIIKCYDTFDSSSSQMKRSVSVR